MKTQTRTTRPWFWMLVALFTLGAGPVGGRSLLEMADEMDRLDQQDFSAAIRKANACTDARLFSCSERELAKAKKLVNGSQDKKTFLAAASMLAREQEQVAEEERLRVAEAERLEEEEEAAEQERVEEERRQEQRRRDLAASEPDPMLAAIASIGNYAAKSLNDYSSMVASQNAQIAAIRRQQQEDEARAAEQRAADAAAAREAQAEARRRQSERARAANLAQAEAQRARQAQWQQAEQERLREEEAARQRQKEAAAAQAAERERVRAAELERQRQAQARADQLAAERAAEAAQYQAEREYLAAMRSGIRLGVKNCFGSYEVGGTMPRIKPEAVSCIDVHYSARCPGNASMSRQVFKNFIGMDVGCFGDTSTITPKPACSASEVQLTVDDVTGCS